MTLVGDGHLTVGLAEHEAGEVVGLAVVVVVVVLQARRRREERRPAVDSMRDDLQVGHSVWGMLKGQ